MKRLLPILNPILVFLSLLLLPLLPTATQAQLPELTNPSPEALAERIRRLAPKLLDATVAIGPSGSPSCGSAVIISADGLLLTAAHVTQRAGAKHKVYLADGRTLPATALGLNHGTDAGLARIDAPGPFPFVPYVKTKTYEVTDWVIATGQPGGPHVQRPPVFRLGRINLAGTTSGFGDAIQTTCTVISGDSGGPLFDLQGRVIGIHSNINMPWNNNNHVPLPCFITDWEDFMANKTLGDAGEQGDTMDDPYQKERARALELLADRPDDPMAGLLNMPRLVPPHTYAEITDRAEPDTNVARRVWLGLRFDPVASLSPSTNGCLITHVLPEGPAAAVGLKPRDRLTHLNDQPVASLPALVRLLRTLPGDHPIPLRVTRGRNVLTPTLNPTTVAVRKHLPHPLGRFVDSMMSDGPDSPMTPQLLNAEAAFAEQLPVPFSLPIELHRDGDPFLLATCVSTQGHFLTKASVIADLRESKSNADDDEDEDNEFDPDEPEVLALEFAGRTNAVTLLVLDDDLDLALLQADALRQHPPVAWRTDPPATAELLHAPTPAEHFACAATQPVRPTPRAGYDYRVIIGETTSYVGLNVDARDLGANADGTEDGTEDDAPLSVTAIEPGSPADLAGLIEGDELLSIDQKPVLRESAFRTLLKASQPGDKLTFRVRRGTAERDIPLILGVPQLSNNGPSSTANSVNGGLTNYSLPDQLSDRRFGFGEAIYHDATLNKTTVGGPLYDLNGEAVGLNIARVYRHRTVALPADRLLAFLDKHLDTDQ